MAAKLSNDELATRVRNRVKRNSTIYRQRKSESGKTQTLVWLPDTIRAQLDEMSQARNQSLSTVTTDLLSAALATPQTPPELGGNPDLDHPQTTTPQTIRERARAVADRVAQMLEAGQTWKEILATLEAEGCRTSHGGLYSKANLESMLHSRARRLAGDEQL